MRRGKWKESEGAGAGGERRCGDCMSQCSQGRTDSSREESKYIGASAAATETENHGGHGQLRKMASPGDEHPQFGCGTQPHVGPVLRQTLLAQIEASAPFENAASGSGGGCHRRKNSPTYLVWTMLRTELHEKGSGENQANPPPLLLKFAVVLPGPVWATQCSNDVKHANVLSTLHYY